MSLKRVFFTMPIILLLCSCQPEEKADSKIISSNLLEKNNNSKNENASKANNENAPKANKEECENSPNSSETSKEVLAEHCKKKDVKIIIEGSNYGKNFGYRCEDEDGFSSGGSFRSKSNECFSLDEAKEYALSQCGKNHPITKKITKIITVQNWDPCDIYKKTEMGNNFGYRCEDEDGLSAGGAIFKGGVCFSKEEALALASIECNRLHPVSNKQMSLINVQNWGRCE